ncbi:hypothetical protein D9M70_373200 [compost metagenome]
MVELFIASRLLVDYFWEYKLLSLLHAALSLALAALLLLYQKKSGVKTCGTDKIFLLFLAVATASFLANPAGDSYVDYLKLLGYFSFYLIGRIAPLKLRYSRTLGLLSILALTALSIFSLIGKGYVSWGSVNTFTGGYFFKSDLAIASIIFLSIAFATLDKKTLLALSLVLSGYLVFKSNARIALPLLVIIPAFLIMTTRGKITTINLKSISLIIITAGVGMAAFALIDFRNLGMLGFDFSDPFSAANTQGRSVIWAALLQAYSNASLTEKLIGMGLNADVEATRVFSESISLEGVRAHNSYLYLLVCTGVAGSLSFYWLIYSIFSKSPFLLKQGNRKSQIIPSLSCAMLIIFLWFSMTTEIIIRPQLMIILFLLSGMHIQSYLNFKNGRHECAPTGRA